MTLHAAIHHVSHYRYDRAVQLGPQVVRLRPAPHSRSAIVSYSLSVEPQPHFINWQQDPFGNHQARLVFPQPCSAFKVSVDLVADMAVFNPFDFFLEPQAETFPWAYDDLLRQELAPYLVADTPEPLLSAYLAGVDRNPQPTIAFLVGLNRRVHQDVRYTIRLEPGVQTPEQTLALGSGSCRDSAWLLVQLLRHCGLAARFVSGYLIQLTPDEKSLDGPSGTDHDFTDLHAWAEVYLPGAGWLGLDATSGLLAGEGHIPLACTPQPTGAAPIEGAVDPCDVQFSHSMTVSRVLETPRVTQPYSEAQWQAINQAGLAVDAALERQDVRLTQGGEPTFVGIDDRDAPQWHTDALGPSKRGLALDLMHRLRERYGAGGFLHLGQGKWYPGEQLPRWALSAYWRTDGLPIWNDPALFADERQAQPRSLGDAQRLITRLAAKLGLNPRHIQAGFEDSWYHLWRERRLPSNVDPLDNRLDDPQERARLRRVFAHGLGEPVGYVLPLGALGHDPQHGVAWTSSNWFLRDERLYLLPGDSPMGYRLPLDSLPWVSPTDAPCVHGPDPFDLQPALPRRASAARNGPQLQAWGARLSPATALHPIDPPPPALGESAAQVVRTALCVEVRDPRRANGALAEFEGQAGAVLYVFMPPLTHLEHYLDLLAAIEDSAAELGLPLVLEGYPPPRDARLRVLQITPDPGVIEVNVQPVTNWAELVEHTTFLYQSAFESRLSPEKFMLDGRHSGTGGGNHMVLGAATPADSPFLRRPDLLASLLAYWHNHPSLSYLFSGLFIGPTSQAPRVDEARNDQLYELEIALAQIHAQRRQGQTVPPWWIDRCLRNLLIDVSGNTHRSAFSIDKLYSPDSPTGRLGLLELRAFEMPPHARMSCVQQLLLRALLAWFWQTPYEAPLARWGTQLHDRWMLPRWIENDIADVVRDLRQVGFAFETDWFAPHFEFRFPRIGAVQVWGMQLELRHALEPWHVLGEESSQGGTARFVDASLERVQVRLSGWDEARYQLQCNGQLVPLQPSGVAGEWVAGVRFKAWNPPSSLHPGIGVHAPLTFDLVDTWLGRAVGGCRYHVAHPGGVNYQRLPVNAFEAEARRRASFEAMGHSPGALPVRSPIGASAQYASPELACTLDLRRSST